MQKYRLFYFPQCPFCQEVFKRVDNSQVALELCDIRMSDKFLNELIERGGKAQVPALDLGDSILYESLDIINFLHSSE